MNIFDRKVFFILLFFCIIFTLCSKNANDNFTFEKYKEKLLFSNDIGSAVNQVKWGKLEIPGEYFYEGPISYCIDNKENIWIVDALNEKLKKIDSEINFYSFEIPEIDKVEDITTYSDKVYLLYTNRISMLNLNGEIIENIDFDFKNKEFEDIIRIDSLNIYTIIWSYELKNNYRYVKGRYLCAIDSNKKINILSEWGEKMFLIESLGNYYMKPIEDGEGLVNIIYNKNNQIIYNAEEVKRDIAIIGIDKLKNTYLLYDIFCYFSSLWSDMKEIKIKKIDKNGNEISKFKIKNGYWGPTKKAITIDSKGNVYSFYVDLDENKFYIWKYSQVEEK
jgi:hypothetical protein